MRLSISRTLIAIFLVIGAVSGAAVFVVGGWVQERSVNSLARGESRRHAELIFQNLYSVMRKGWTKDEIGELVDRINAANPDLSVAVHRSKVVAQDFGEIERDRVARTTDPLVAEAMAGGGEVMAADETTLRFIYPLTATEECLGCHVSAKAGAVNGVIDIRVPLEKLRIPLEFTLHTVIGVFAALVALLFAATLVILRYSVAKPMHHLAEVINGIVASGDLGRRVDGRSFEWMSELRSLAGNFNRLMEQLEGSRQELLRQSTTDPLTGLNNRRQFNEAYTRELERALRHNRPLSVIMIDLDGFKPINDKWGHATGDTMLRRAAAAMVCHVRVNDTVARLGGDEFIVLAPDTDREGAQVLGEKLAAAIEGERVEIHGERVTVGASIGVASLPQDGVTADDVLTAADEAMYANKRARKAARNRALTEP